jgi:outer membrane protein assembly factor BamB
LVVVSVVSLLVAGGWAQSTGGYSPQRANFNPDAGELAPPIEPFRSLLFPPGFLAETFAVHNGYLVAGSGGPVTRYLLYDEAVGLTRWVVELPGSDGPLRYSPAFNTDMVLLGSSSTSTVTAVELATGQILWDDWRVGAASGRHPFLTNGLALYHGSRSLAAVNPDTGLAFWRFPATSSTEEIAMARAPIAAYGDQVYLQQADGTLRALSLITGDTRWISFGAGSHGSNPIPTVDMVFIQNAGSEAVHAVSTLTGERIWEQVTGGVFGDPGIAYGYGRLYAFLSRQGNAVVVAMDPGTGDVLWEYAEPLEGEGAPQFGLLADGMIYFYNSGTGRLRGVDAFTGALRWSRLDPEVRGLAADAGRLYVLHDAYATLYSTAHYIVIPHLADGQGASTLVTVVNLGDQEMTGTMQLFNSDGDPLALWFEGAAEPLSTVPVVVPAGGTGKFQTLGLSEEVTAGWARIWTNQPLRGTAVYQTSDGTDILFEAGVADAPAVNEARLFVSRAFRNPASPFSTGVAIVNPGDEPVTVSLHFLRSVPTFGNFLYEVALAPGQHLARFLEELFPGEAEPGAEGTLILLADGPVAVTALRTQKGFQMSSYPVGVPLR